MKTTLQILKDARHLIEKPQHWCKEVEAVDKEGNQVSAHSPSASAFCIVGAVRKASDHSMFDVSAWDYLHKLVVAQGYFSLSNFNDGKTHEEVLKLFDKVILQCTEPVSSTTSSLNKSQT